ncbi:MAG: hypothetical protein OXG58_04155 [Gemmatimonadetes bacterium]|nr:hypothetical protein [Gemmatimonadota bacterium]MCY3943584.1 hypothetical protein [Gemmatimonadota bacterium]
MKHIRRRSPWLSRAVAAVVAAASVLSPDCFATAARSENPLAQGAHSERREIELLVRNQNFNRATVYATASGGSSRKIGVVGGHSQATLKFDWPFSYIRLRIRFLAGDEVVTETMSVFPGELLELVIG